MKAARKVFASGLAGVVLFATTYSLILPALTVEIDTVDEIPGYYPEESLETAENAEAEFILDEDFPLLNEDSFPDYAKQSGALIFEDDTQILCDGILMDEDEWDEELIIADDEFNEDGEDIESISEGDEETDAISEGDEETDPIIEDGEETLGIGEDDKEPAAIGEDEDKIEAVSEAEDEPESVSEAEDEPESVSEAEEEPESVSEAEEETESVSEAEEEPESVSEAEEEPESVSEAEEETESISEAEEETESVSEAEEETESVSEGEDETEDEQMTELSPQQIFSAATDKVLVMVYAPEGAFPEGTAMTVNDVEDAQTIETIANAVSEEALPDIPSTSSDAAGAGSVQVKSVFAVDITFYDADGLEIEPCVPVKVVLSPVEVDVSQLEPVIVHVDHDGQAQIIEKDPVLPSEIADEFRAGMPENAALEDAFTAAPLLMPDTVEENLLFEETVSDDAASDVIFEAASFSIYAVVIIENADGTRTLTADGDDYTIKITFGPDAEIPADTLLEVDEIPGGSDEWQSYYERILVHIRNEAPAGPQTEIINEEGSGDAVINVERLRLFDIKLISEERQIEPEDAVDVEIIYRNVADSSPSGTPMAAHFAADGLELINPEVLENVADESREYSFTQDSFSITGTFYQVQDLDRFKDGEKYVIMNKGYDGDGDPIWRVLSAERVKDYTIYGPGALTVRQMANLYCDSTCIWTMKIDNVFDVSTNTWTKSYELYNEDTKTYLSLHGDPNTSDALMTSSATGLGIGTENDGTNTFWIANGWSWNGWSNGWQWEENGSNTRYLGIKNNMDPLYVNKGPDSVQGFEFHQILPEEITDTSPLPEPKQPNTDMLERFKAELNESIPIKESSKTAEVYDYDNRIYEIDLTAKSGYRAMDQDIELAFITDVSNSMLFASSITPVGKNYSYRTTSNNKIVGDVSGFTDKSQVYIIIGDPTSESTQYAVWWDSSQNAWVAVDASYYAKRKYWELTGIELVDNKGRSPKDWWKDNDGSVTRRPHKLASEIFAAKFNPNQNYPIYVPTEDKWLGGFGDIFSVSTNAQNRLYYLKQNVDMAIEAMKVVAGTSDESTVKVALETFCKSVPSNGFDFRDVRGLNDLTTYLNNITTADGTNQRWALKQFNEGNNGKDYAKNWSKDDGKKKYVIVISDGAPNVKSGDDGMELRNTPANVREQAAYLEEKGARVFSIALSMGDVDYGRRIMASIATDVNEDYYVAENENEFEEVFYDILHKMIAEATVVGKVEDTIDECFYPVDRDGNAIPEGSYIDTSGKVIAEPGDKETMPYGKIEKSGDNYKVTWYNQDISWDGWHGRIYVKSKEDYLGGNAINTNKGEAVITPEKFYVSLDSNTGKPNTVTLPANKAEMTVSLPTPYVNVDELALSQEKTEWTVYLGDTVDPLTHLKGFYDDIKVLEVVTESSGDHVKTADGLLLYDQNFDREKGDASNDSRRPKTGTTPESFPLKDVIKGGVVVAGKAENSEAVPNSYFNAEGSLTDDGWKHLLSGGTIYLRYTEYGHTSGVIEL